MNEGSDRVRETRTRPLERQRREKDSGSNGWDRREIERARNAETGDTGPGAG